MTTPRSTTRRPDVLLALALGGLFAFALGFSLAWRPGPAQVEALPAPTVEAPASPAPTAAQEPVSAPVEVPAPVPTGWIEGTYPTAAPQLAPAAPAAPPVVYSELVPLDNKGSAPKPCNHPRCQP